MLPQALLVEISAAYHRTAALLELTLADEGLVADYALDSLLGHALAGDPNGACARLGYPMSTAVSRVNRMVERGDAERIRNPRDGRSAFVVAHEGRPPQVGAVHERAGVGRSRRSGTTSRSPTRRPPPSSVLCAPHLKQRSNSCSTSATSRVRRETPPRHLPPRRRYGDRFAYGAAPPPRFVSKPPDTLRAGAVWVVTVRPSQPVGARFQIRQSARRASFALRPQAGVSRANVVFPRPGAWSYGVLLGGRFTRLGATHVHQRSLVLREPFDVIEAGGAICRQRSPRRCRLPTRRGIRSLETHRGGSGGSRARPARRSDSARHVRESRPPPGTDGRCSQRSRESRRRDPRTGTRCGWLALRR